MLRAAAIASRPKAVLEDAARAAMRAIEWPADVFNVVDDDPATGAEWLPVFAVLPHSLAKCRLFGAVATYGHAAPPPSMAFGAIDKYQRASMSLASSNEIEIFIADYIRHLARDRLKQAFRRTPAALLDPFEVEVACVPATAIAHRNLAEDVIALQNPVERIELL